MYPPTESAPPLPPDVSADPSAAATPGASSFVTLPIDDKFLQRMFKEIEDAEQKRKEMAIEWDILIDEYNPVVIKSGQPESVKTNAHFRNIHTKLAQTFYQYPELYLEAQGPLKDPVGINPLNGQPITAEDAVNIKRQVLNKKLGDDGADISRTMDECLLDAYSWSGVACVKIGYRPTIKMVQEPIMVPGPAPAPLPQPGAVLGLSAPPEPAQPPPPVPLIDPETGEPAMRNVPVTIHEEWYARRFSAKKLLVHTGLKSSRVDEDACWVGMDFFMTGEQLKSTYQFTPDATPQAKDDLVANQAKDKDGSTGDKYHLYELWLRAAEYDPNQPHPLAIYQLILLKGERTKAVVYRPSTDQTFDEQGKLTPDSVTGFPIEILNIRDAVDTLWTKSDSAFTNSQIKQLNTHRQQSVRIRDAAVAKMLYDEGAFTAEEVQRIKDMKIGDWMAVAEGRLSGGADKIMAPATQPTKSRDDNTTAFIIKQDMDETLGISGQEAGVTDAGNTRTATEVATASSKSAARMGKDRQRAVKFFLKIVRKYDSYLIRYATEDDYVTIVGKMGEQRLMVWNSQIIAGKYAYNIKPDSQLFLDVARDRQQTLTFYKETKDDQRVNQTPVLKKLAQQFALDPSEIVQDPALAQMAAQGAPVAGAPVVAPEPTPGPSATIDSNRTGGPRLHIATGARPNTPELGQAPNAQRPA